MKSRVLIVEDHILIALEIEEAVEQAGHEVIAIVSNRQQALKHIHVADVALVDINLADGSTGPDIGEKLAQAGASVIFLMGNPEIVAGGVPGAVGVMSKPFNEPDLSRAVRFAADRAVGLMTPPPAALKLFPSATMAR